MDAIDEWATKYKELMERSNRLAKQAERYKKRIETLLTRHHQDTITTPSWKIRRSTFHRTMMVKKETPPDIWEKYAVVREQKMVYITPMITPDTPR